MRAHPRVRELLEEARLDLLRLDAADAQPRLMPGGRRAIDLPLASAGSLFGMALGSTLAAAYGHILVVAAEKMSRIALKQPMNPSKPGRFCPRTFPGRIWPLPARKMR